MKTKIKNVLPRRGKISPADIDKIVKTIHQLSVRDLRGPMLETPAPIAAYIRERQNLDFTKKFKFCLDDSDLREKAFRKFRGVNVHMANQQMDFPSLDAPRVLASMPDLQRVLLRARAVCHSILTPLGNSEFFANCKNSGGTSQGVSFSDTSTEAKSMFPITITAKARPLFSSAMLHNYQLCDAIEIFNSTNQFDSIFEEVEASRATTVPKTNKIDRMIAIEPTGNMYLQQGLMHSMYNRLASIGLDVSTLPDIHKSLAREGSKNGRLATIDFSSASDCVSIELLRFLLPKTWFRLLDTVRCTSLRMNSFKETLNMFSTMGNATTFPIETLVFYALAIGSIHTHKNTDNSLHYDFQSERDVSVFGDDCIVPTVCADLFMKSCTSVGFMVNFEKSFYHPSDNFRESCGGDYLSGYDVRPFCIKRPAASGRMHMESWLYIVTNALLKKYFLYFGELSYFYGKHVFRYIDSLFTRFSILKKVVPNDYPDDAGIHISHDMKRFSLCYPGNFSKVTRDVHGLYYFHFNNFRYRKRKRQFEYIRYCERLQAWSRDEFTKTERVPFVNIRKIGGYVVAKGQDLRWGIL